MSRGRFDPLLERARREAPFQRLAEGTRVVFQQSYGHGNSYAFGVVIRSDGWNKCQLAAVLRGPSVGDTYKYKDTVKPDWSRIDQSMHWVFLLPSDPTGAERLYHHLGRGDYDYEYDGVYDEKKEYVESYCNYD
jgi:hypothetical protein